MKLFKKLAAIHSASGEEDKMIRYIKSWVKSSVHNAKIKIDYRNNNIYITKGEADTYPCVVAHLDQVQKAYPADYRVVETNEILFGYSPSLRKQCGLGADDKCGIWIALKMLKKHDAIKVAFFSAEEVGCIGSSAARMDFFKDVRFVIEPDRRGHNDLITNIGWMDICSEDFKNAINFQSFGYKEEHGLMTDVETLRDNGLEISCINLSCGYYSPHTEEEYVVKADMLNCKDFVDHIITNCTDVYPFEAQEPAYASYYGRGGDIVWGRGAWSRRSPKKNKYVSKFERFAEEDEVDELPFDINEHDKQYDEMREYVLSDLEDIPDMSARELKENWGAMFPALTEEDFNNVIEEFLDNLEAMTGSRNVYDYPYSMCDDYDYDDSYYTRKSIK